VVAVDGHLSSDRPGVKKELSHTTSEVFVLESKVASWGNELRQ
jgi:hypothetical protein